jgi:hypothetical protein
MTYDSIAILEPDVPQASDPLFHHLIARGVGADRVQLGFRMSLVMIPVSLQVL